MIEDVLRSLLAAAWAAGWLLAAYALASRAAGRGRPLVRWVAAAVLLAWLPVVAFHLLAAARLFSIGPACVVTAVLAVAGWRLAGGAPGVLGALRRERAFAGRLARRARRGPHRYWALAFVALAAPGLLRALILPPLGWDSLTYHAVKAALWVQNAGADAMTAPGTWSYYRDMLGGGEVLTAWAMLPMRSDALTGIVEVLQWLALGLAVTALARCAGAREPFSSTAGAFVVSIPTVKLLLGSGYVELGLLLALVGGLVLAIEGARRRPALLAVSGAALGVAAATKLPMVPVGAGVLAIVLGHALLRGSRRARLAALAGALAFAAALGPFVLATWLRTGAPFAPFPLRLGGVVLAAAPPEVAWYLDRPVPASSALAAEAAALARIFHAPLSRSEALGLLTLVPIAAAPFGFPALRRRSPLAAVLIGFVVTLTALSYFSPGFAPIRYRWSDSSSRFLAPLAALAVVASVAGRRPGSRASRAYALALRAIAVFVLALHAFYGFSPASLLGIAIVAAALTAGGYAVRLGRRLPGGATRACAALVLCAAGFGALSTLRGALRYDFIAMDVAIHITPRYWAKALPMVDEPGTPRRLALTSGPWQDLDNWLAYPFMGRRLQNRVLYVPVARDGSIGHFARGATNEELAKTSDYAAWLARLHERGVTEVMSFKPASLELAWMDANPSAFERLAGLDGHWGLYRLRDQRPPSM